MQPEEKNQLNRVRVLWFEHGNLILRVENSLFRVSKGLLAAHSSVFWHMLSFPQTDKEERIDGCPVVRLHDSAADVTCFLRAIFDSRYVRHNLPHQPTNQPYPAGHIN